MTLFFIAIFQADALFVVIAGGSAELAGVNDTPFHFEVVI